MIQSVHDELLRSGSFAPAGLGGAEERLWLDCDLASLAENRLRDRTDPRQLDEARRADWTARATMDRPWALRARSEYETCYWLLDAGERVGTIAVSASTLGGRRAHVASFYVFPTHRGRGIGRRALATVESVVGHNELGLRLDTNWTWQRAARFYLDTGMWLYMWKRDLTFFWDADTPRHRIEVGARTASLSVDLDRGAVVLARARRNGDALELDEPAPDLQGDKRLGDAYWHATTTFSLALALHGWPLIRSQEEYDDGYHADGGPPEALAYKIGLWEAWDRSRGWAVETPRIPGIAYPTWAELEARWERQRVEFEAQLKRQQ